MPTRKRIYLPHSVSTLKKIHIHRLATSKNMSRKMPLSTWLIFSSRWERRHTQVKRRMRSMMIAP